MVTCPKCGYKWQTKSTADMICCPSCQRKFNRPARQIRILARKVPLHASCTDCGCPKVDLNVCEIDGEPAFLCEQCLRQEG